MQSFRDQDINSIFDNLNKNHATPEFTFSKKKKIVLFNITYVS